MASSTYNITSQNIGDYAPYHYVPTKSVVVTFITLYGISTLLHVVQAFYFRLWWLLPTAGLAGLLEVTGWSGRLWSYFNPLLISPFQMQITATIIAPTPLLAANFVILARIIRTIGPRYTRLGPKWYTIIFCVCDFISLSIQGVGGGLASAESSSGGNARLGANVMLGGIVFQLGTIVIMSVLAVEFLFRYSWDRPIRHHGSRDGADGIVSKSTLDTRAKIMIAALGFNTLCLFIRSVYRTVELSGGWNGVVITTQLYFNILDGGMVTLAIFTLNIAHPGLLLFRESRKSSALHDSSSSASDMVTEANGKGMLTVHSKPSAGSTAMVV